MNRICVAFAAGLLACPAVTAADVTFDLIGPGYATAISADGTVVVGNTQGDYETFRWTEGGGVVPLGQATVPVLGSGAGTPDVSADGTQVSATILGADSTYSTQGRWTQGLGWQETMPPFPPSGGLFDGSYGSGWGISGDGNVLVGLYWRPGATDGSAHPSAWTKGGGVVDLGTSGGSGRANDADADGNVIVGWEENPNFGNWWPTVWVDGVRTNLSTDDAFAEATCVNPAGTIAAGYALDEGTGLISGAVWRWSGSSWDEEILGTLPGHHTNFGTTIPNDMTPDGSLIVGYDRRSSPGDATGFLWTAGTGLINVVDFLADHGVSTPAGFVIRSLTGVSDDGRILTGSGEEIFPPWTARSFVIRLDSPVAVPSVVASHSSRMRVFPNPMRTSSTVLLDIPGPASVDLAVYDSAGRLVRRVLDGSAAPAGSRRVDWDGRDGSGKRVAAGVYHVRVHAGDHIESKQLVVVR